MGTSFLSMMEMKMPPGFRFHPRDEELINDYLAKKLYGDSVSFPMMVDVDLNKVEPWDLPGEACVGGKEWYFFSLRDRKYATGQRTNRATLSGYWKATGKDRPVQDTRKGGRLVGMRKTLVFYQGRAPKGKKTDWVMHEFRIEPPTNISSCGGGDLHHRRSSNQSILTKEDWVLCRVFYKSRGLAAKPSNLISATAGSENCYDDTGSSSLPPLIDTFNISFEQSHLLSQQGLYSDHVPCFSSLLSSAPLPPLRHRPHLDPALPVRQLLALSDLNPFMGAGYISSEKKVITAHEQFGKVETGSQKVTPLPEGSSESFLTEAGGQSVWTSY